MTSPWERLEGRTPVNATAARLIRKMPDQENQAQSSAAMISELESENIRLKQELVMANAETFMVMESQAVILEMLLKAMAAVEDKTLLALMLDEIDIPAHLCA